jgi:deoxyribodipyrimidine photo-lyase
MDMHQSRVRLLREKKQNGSVTVALISRDQRVRDNHALFAAQQDAITKKRPFVVLFNLYPKRNNRIRQQYDFMIHGLKQVEQELNDLKIPLYVMTGDLATNISRFHDRYIIDSLYFDFSPLREAQDTRKQIARTVPFSCYEVDTHNVVPVWTASGKEEYAAYTIRPKIHNHLPDYLVEPEQLIEHPFPFKESLTNDWGELSQTIKAPVLLNYTLSFQPGEEAARATLNTFLENRLAWYADRRNDPNADMLSDMSPYLHFGQISSLRVILEAKKYIADRDNEKIRQSYDTLVEEMIVRKELSDNFCYYNSHYDSLKGAHSWAKQTLHEHWDDKREHIYSYDQLEHAQTHDPAWNACQEQMTSSGKMHGYMRMYWAKKILEWTKNPEEALKIAIILNDTYEIDGYDPNGYTGIMWSIAGVHDRAWTERPIFGKIRYMNANGLKRKFTIEKYIERWSTQEKLY